MPGRTPRPRSTYFRQMCSEGPSGLNRRGFLRASLAIGAVGLWGAREHASGIKSVAGAMTGRVAVVRDPRMVGQDGEGNEELLRGWVTRSLERLTGERGKDAWRVFFSPQDRIAIKVNAMGGPRIATRPALAMALARGIMEAGVPGPQILLWDRTSRELQQAGYSIREDGKGPLCFGTDRWGYESIPAAHRSIGSCFSLILTRWATVLIDVPVLKDHDLAGVSLSMKNLFGVIHNPNKYHDQACAPYLVDLLEHPYVHGRLRLVVCDGIRAQCHGGPSYAGRWTWPFGGLLVGADPVAVDRIGESILSDRRRELGLPSLEEEGRPPSHIAMAGERGLGESQLKAIRILELGG